MRITQSDIGFVHQSSSFPEYTLMLVGTALDGPSRIPFRIKKPGEVRRILGDCPLSDAYQAAHLAGATDIILYRLNGKPAKALVRYVTDTENHPIMELTSVGGSDKYHQIQLIMYGDHLYVDETQIGGGVRTYYYDRYPTVYDLVYALNQDAFYGLISFTAKSLDSEFRLQDLPSDYVLDIPFQGGDSESHLVLDRQADTYTDEHLMEIKQYLLEGLFGEDPEDQAAFHPVGQLGLLSYGVIALVDMFHDDGMEFTEILSEFCKQKTLAHNDGCIGVIGTASPLEESLEDETFLDTLANQLLQYTPSRECEYVQVVTGDTYYHIAGRPVSLAYAYAGAQVTLSPHTMMTNKSLSGVGGLRYKFSKEMIDSLTQKGYICIVPSIRRGYVPYRATTFTSNSSSMYAKPHCIRIMQVVTRAISHHLDSLIGSIYERLSLSDIQESLEEVLDGFVGDEILRDYYLLCKLDSVSSTLHVTLTLVPYSEIESITTSSSIIYPEGMIL